MQTKMHFFLPLMAALAMCGCSKEEPQAADPYDTPYARIKDPEYAKALGERMESRKDLMAEAARISQELAAEKEKNPDSPRVKELEAAQAELSERVLAHRRKTEEIVRNRMNQEGAAIKARAEREAKGANK